MFKRQKEVSIRFNKNYNFLQILLINIVKFICGCGFDYFTIYPGVKTYFWDSEDALKLTQRHLL